MATHDDHGDHAHGDGHAAVAWEIIPENSGFDGALIVLAFACLLGLFAFSALMETSPLLHEHHSEVPSNENPSGSQAH